MSWPTEDLSEKWVDWSWFNNYNTMRVPRYLPFDVDEFLENYPECQGAIIRAVWPSGVKDAHYDHYYDGFTRNGRHVAAYLWPNPTKSLDAQIEDFHRALGQRVPPLMGYDYEDTGTFGGKTPQQLSSLMARLHDRVRLEWDESEHINYSRGSWLDLHIIPGEWFHDILWWLAHWIYPPPDYTDQAAHWQEIDAILPIDNLWTPNRGKVVKIKQENVIGWQGSARGEIVPRGYSDLDWFLKSFVSPIYNGGNGGPPPPPPVEKIQVGVTVPIGKADVTVREI